MGCSEKKGLDGIGRSVEQPAREALAVSLVWPPAFEDPGELPTAHARAWAAPLACGVAVALAVQGSVPRRRAGLRAGRGRVALSAPEDEINVTSAAGMSVYSQESYIQNLALGDGLPG